MIFNNREEIDSFSPRSIENFVTPSRAGEQGELIATLFQVERLWGEALGPWQDRVKMPEHPAEVETTDDTDSPGLPR